MTGQIKSGDYLHKEHPKTKAPDDFWGQVSRTVNGEPVSQMQIDMIVRAIREGLDLEPTDVLLDIACGNGALSQYFFAECRQFRGVDFSAYLIEVAKANFEKPPNYTFEEAEALHYVSNEQTPEVFTKALCYGAFSYFADASALLKKLAQRFTGIETVYVGNLPDRDRAHLFYRPDQDYRSLLGDKDSTIGIWRNQEELTSLANEAGWNVEFYQMPDEFYAARYRFDAILRRS